MLLFVPQYIFSFSPLRVELRDGGGGFSLVKNDCRFFVVVIHHSGLFFFSNSDLPKLKEWQYRDFVSPRIEGLSWEADGYSLIKNDCRFFAVDIHHSGVQVLGIKFLFAQSIRTMGMSRQYQIWDLGGDWKIF